MNIVEEKDCRCGEKWYVKQKCKDYSSVLCKSCFDKTGDLYSGPVLLYIPLFKVTYKMMKNREDFELIYNDTK